MSNSQIKKLKSAFRKLQENEELVIMYNWEKDTNNCEGIGVSSYSINRSNEFNEFIEDYINDYKEKTKLIELYMENNKKWKLNNEIKISSSLSYNITYEIIDRTKQLQDYIKYKYGIDISASNDINLLNEARRFFDIL